MKLDTQKIIVIILLSVLSCIAPYYLKKSILDNNQNYLIISFILFSLLLYLIYYSLKIKVDFLTTVLAFKLFPILVLSIISSFVFNEFKFTLTKWIALFFVLIGAYVLEM